MTISKYVKMSKSEVLSINQKKDRSGRRRTERTQENNPLQKTLIEDPRILATKNDLDIRKSNFN